VWLLAGTASIHSVVCHSVSPHVIIIIIIMQRLTRHVLVIRMTNRRRGVHVDLRVAVSVIKLFEFLFDVQVASDDVR